MHCLQFTMCSSIYKQKYVYSKIRNNKSKQWWCAKQTRVDTLDWKEQMFWKEKVNTTYIILYWNLPLTSLKRWFSCIFNFQSCRPCILSKCWHTAVSCLQPKQGEWKCSVDADGKQTTMQFWEEEKTPLITYFRFNIV